MYRAFKDIGVTPLQFQIYCFTCRQFFTFKDYIPPEQCWAGAHKWTKGEFCRPDLVLHKGKFDAVVRVDGSIHDKKKNIKVDHIQNKTLLEHGIKVFIIRNEQIVEYSNRKLRVIDNWIPMAYASMIWLMMDKDKLYKELYLKSGHWKEFGLVKID